MRALGALGGALRARPDRRVRGGRPAALARALRALPRSLPALTPRLRRRLVLIVAVCLILAGGYQFWLRDSSLVAVDDVKVTGLTTSDSTRVRVALTAAARDMTTLDVDRERLDRAVAAYPVVRALEVTADFPHGLRVHVLEHHAAALAVGDTGKLPVAGDGTILRGLPAAGKLPVVQVDGPLGDDRLTDRTALAEAAVAGAAPGVLRKRVEQVVKRPDQGLVAELSDGPELIFGSASRLAVKWAAAARVLADPEAAGASYIDLRIPSRPAAGGLPAATVEPVAPAGGPATLPTPGARAATATPTGGATTAPPGAATGAPPTGAADPTATDPSATAPYAPTGPPTGTTTPPATTTAPPAPQTATPPAQPPVTGPTQGGAGAPATP